MKKEMLKKLVCKLNELKEKGIFDEEYDSFKLFEIPERERIQATEEIISLFDNFKTDVDLNGCCIIFDLSDELQMILSSTSEIRYHWNRGEFMNRLRLIYFNSDNGSEELLKLCEDTKFVN